MSRAHEPALNQVTVSVTDMDRAWDFYTRLGLHPIVRSDHYARFVTPGNEATFSLHRADSVGSSTVIYFEVEDLDGYVTMLEARGVTMLRPPADQPWQWREAYVADPDGNTVCLYHAGRIRLNPDWRLPESRQRHGLSRDEFRHWLEAYKAAWESRNPEAAAELFAEDAEYFETPYTPPARGRGAILDYWSAVPRNQRDVSFGYEIVNVYDGVGFCKWTASFTRIEEGRRVELDGIFEVGFDADGRCRTFREWWHRNE